MKLCSICDSIKYSKGLCRSHYEKQLINSNKERQLENCKKWNLANKERKANSSKQYREKAKKLPGYKEFSRNRALKRCYGITSEDYNKMIFEQDFKCKLCLNSPASDKRLHVDHNHDTGKVRGLLCHQCNWYLGKIDRDVHLLERISDYIK